MLLCVFLCLPLRGTDEEANAYVREAEKQKKDRSFVSAAEQYLAAAKFADQVVGILTKELEARSAGGNASAAKQ